MEHLFERANYKNYQNIWSKEMFDRVIGFDSSNDKRYEIWLLTIFKNMLVKTITNQASYVYDTEIGRSLGKEKVNIIVKTIINNFFIFGVPQQKSFTDFIFEKLPEDIKLLPSVKPESVGGMDFKDQSVFSAIEFFNPFTYSDSSAKWINNYLLTNEDVPALMEALKIHKWASDANKIPPAEKNISNIQSISQLFKFVQPLREEFEGATDTINFEGGKGYEGEDVRAGKDFVVLGTDKRATIVKILSFLGSEYWAKGTSWCIRGADYRPYGSEGYFKRYTANGQAPAIFYIQTTENGKKYKMAFLEGEGVQYRDPKNDPLGFDELMAIPDEHKKLLAKHLWFFGFLTGAVKEKIDYDQYVELVGEPDGSPAKDLFDLQVHEVVDFKNLKKKNWEDMTPAEQKFIEGFDEIVDEILMEIDYENLKDEDIAGWIDNEEPQGGYEGEDCPACNKTGFSIRSNDYTDRYGWRSYKVLTKEEYDNILAKIKEKLPKLTDTFASAYEIRDYRGHQKAFLVDKDKMIAVARKAKHKCKDCEGTGSLDGDPIWSDEQRERAEKKHRDSQYEYAEEGVVRDFNNASMSNIGRNFRDGKKVAELLEEYYQETVVKPYKDSFNLLLSVSNLDEIKEKVMGGNYQGATEKLGEVFVAKRGYKIPSNSKPPGVIERLLRRFK